MAAKTNSIIAGCIKWLCSKEISVYELSIKNPNTSNYLILFRHFKDIEFFLNLAKISQILENFAKISNKFLWQNFLDIILEHFMETAWIVGPLRQAKRIFSWILLRHRIFLNIPFFLGNNFFTRPSTAGIIRMRVLIEGWYYHHKLENLKFYQNCAFFAWQT